MALQVIPEWIVNLDDEDVSFIKKFLFASGSLKEMAKQYEVTYPTVRLRLDRLIQKIQISEDNTDNPCNYISYLFLNHHHVSKNIKQYHAQDKSHTAPE